MIRGVDPDSIPRYEISEQVYADYDDEPATGDALGAETGKVGDTSNVVSLMVGAIVGFLAAAILAGGDDDERY